MQKHTHLALGAVFGIIGSTAILNSAVLTMDTAYYATGVVIGSLLPDIDHTRSSLGRKFPIISKIVSIVFKHRTFTHSLLFCALVYAFTYSWNETVAAGILLGMLSHIAGDMGTNRGVQLLYPYDRYFSFPVTIRTGGFAEQLVFLLLVGVAGVSILLGVI